MEGFKTIIEPFKIKMVEPIRFPDRATRVRELERAGYNPFRIPAEQVVIDLLTDSGTCAMSTAQWAKMMEGDEAYAGGRSFFEFEEVVRDLTGYEFVIPTHQGRAAEHLLFALLGGPGKLIPNNSHFDTTRANIEVTGAEARDVLIPEGKNTHISFPFKGNMDLGTLDELLESPGPSHIPAIMMTVTNNTAGGQPVSLENIRAVSTRARARGIPFFLDACRFAENAYLIKLREPGYSGRSVKSIAQEMFSLADGCTMSAKKDGLVNIGGFLALNDSSLASRLKELEILTEGFPTYGGLAGRDLAAIAQGLREVVDEDYLAYRQRSLRYLGELLDRSDVPYLRPVGGHAVYLDAARFFPQIPVSQYPGQALVCELYLEGGVRSVEVGSVMFGTEDPRTGAEIPHCLELVRLALPRRVYTQSHVDFVGEVIERVRQRSASVRGLVFVEKPKVLRHFTARFAPAPLQSIPTYA